MSVPISSQLNLGSDRSAAQSWVLSELGPVLAKAGFNAVGTATDSTTFSRRYLPSWALVIGILTLPFGLLILALARSTDVVVVALDQAPEGFVLATATGKAPRKVRDLLIKLNTEGVAMYPSEVPPAPVRRAVT